MWRLPMPPSCSGSILKQQLTQSSMWAVKSNKKEAMQQVQCYLIQAVGEAFKATANHDIENLGATYEILCDVYHRVADISEEHYVTAQLKMAVVGVGAGLRIFELMMEKARIMAIPETQLILNFLSREVKTYKSRDEIAEGIGLIKRLPFVGQLLVEMRSAEALLSYLAPAKQGMTHFYCLGPNS